MNRPRFGFGTNGLAGNRLPDALRLLADLGYAGVALTLDQGHLDPYGEDLAAETKKVAALLDQLGLALVIETGARYLLDPCRKHHPTLLSQQGAEKRIDFLERAIHIGAELGAEAVSFWSGVAPAAVPSAVLWDRLVSGCEEVVAEADRYDVQLGFEPEPGMFVESLDQFDVLASRLGEPSTLGITLDIGHCRCLETQFVPDCVRRTKGRLVNVQIDDMCRGRHEHLEFGAGEIDFPPVIAALQEIEYRGLISVELPRHSHDGPGVAARSISFLRSAAGLAESPRDLIDTRLTAQAAAWLDQAVAAIADDPLTIDSAFPFVGRHCGRAVADEARAALIAALPYRGRQLADELMRLYHHGDAAERRAVLIALDFLDLDEAAVPLVLDATRTNDLRLVSAALGPYAARFLDDNAYRQAVLKCVFTGIPVDGIAGLPERADATLARMLADYVAERRAAGRDVPDDVWPLLSEDGSTVPSTEAAP